MRQVKRASTRTRIEELFDTPYEQLTIDDGYIEQLKAKGLRYRCKIIRSGDMIEIIIYPVNPVWRKLRGIKRIAVKPSREVQENLNRENRRRWVSRLIHANFTQHDTWATFAFDKHNAPVSVADARKHLKNYLTRLRCHIKKHGLEPLKYIYVIEQTVNENGEHVNTHCHVVMNFQDRNKAEELWKHGGRTHTRRIQPDTDGSIEGLAKYISKPETKTKTRSSQKSYATSKGLKDQVQIRTTEGRLPGTTYTVSKRRVAAMANDRNIIREVLTKHLPGYTITGEPIVKVSDMAAGAFIYTRMMRLPPPRNAPPRKRRN